MLFRLLLFLATLSVCVADTVANCTFKTIVGKWTLYEGVRNQNSSIDCTKNPTPARKVKIELHSPNIVTDQYGNTGNWTMIWNQGFELTINYRVYFGFSDFNKTTNESYCTRTQPGWAHNIYGKDWSCFYGLQRSSEPHGPEIVTARTRWDVNRVIAELKSRKYRIDYAMIDKINKMQEAWTAGPDTKWEKYNLYEVLQLSGGINPRSWMPMKKGPNEKLSKEMKDEIDKLPKAFDWRNHNGQNFVSPVLDQTCGNCYAYASTGMLEARYRIITNNTFKPIFSTQDITECCQYSQGCHGGFAYLVAGKYGADYGLVLNECNRPIDPPKSCKVNATCQRYYTADYKYIGGYYGAGSEPLMRLSLVKNGPIAVEFKVAHCPMIYHYKRGIFCNTGLTDIHNQYLLDTKTNFWEDVNHAVIIVGYGRNETLKMDYWIVKNSWGEKWGHFGGYFLLQRGTDECNIESMPMEAWPIIN